MSTATPLSRTAAAVVRPDHDPATALAALRALERARVVRRATVTLALVLVALAVCLVALSTGELPVGIGDVLATALGRGDDLSRLVLVDFRLPRLVLGVLVGLAFGVAGSLFQSVLQNPLASPDIIGVTQGASVGAVTVLLLLGLGGALVPLGALAGAAAVALLNVLLAWRGGLAGHRFVLVGIALAFGASSVLGYALTRSDARDAQTALTWLSGSVAGADWPTVVPLVVVLAVVLPLVVLLGRDLGMLEMGDLAAAPLGVRATRVRLAALALGVVLAAAATAAAGPVAFVALVSGPIARRLVADGRPAPLQAGLVGVVMVALADLVAQHLVTAGLSDVQVPVGIVTGIVGGPYLVWLMAGRGRSAVPGAAGTAGGGGWRTRLAGLVPRSRSTVERTSS